MKRRVCESCLYFESAGFNRNGWCHHPSRRQNSDVRLMVRSNELGCRNGWNADLWVPSETDDGVDQRSQPHDSIGGRAKSEVEPAQQNDLITSIVAAKTDNMALPPDRKQVNGQVQAAVEEDIFVKQTPSLSWSTGPISSQPASELVQDPRAAILRARDQFRERRRTEGRLADRAIDPQPAPLLASSREARLVDKLDLVETEMVPESVDPKYENRPLLRPAAADTNDTRRPVAPVKLREIDRPFPSMTDFPEDRLRFESVPHVEASASNAVTINDNIDDTWIETRQIDTVPPELYEVDEFFDEEEVFGQAEAPEEVELSVRHRESTLNRYFRQRRERRERASHPSIAAHDGPVGEPSAELATEFVELQDARQPDARIARNRPSEHLQAAVEQVVRAANHVEPPSASRTSALGPGERGFQTTEERQRTATPRPATDPDDDFALPPPLPELPPGVLPEQRSASRSRPRIEQTAPLRRSEPRRENVAQPAVDEFGDQPLFASSPLPPAEDYEIDSPYSMQPAQAAPSFRLERICQTCRDFRPADNGERGWCNNKWAFNHRRMVDADDLGCRNSLGSWWTPKDDVWRRDGDISRHAQQTPRVDQWLFGTNSEENERRRPGS